MHESTHPISPYVVLMIDREPIFVAALKFLLRCIFYYTYFFNFFTVYGWTLLNPNLLCIKSDFSCFWLKSNMADYVKCSTSFSFIISIFTCMSFHMLSGFVPGRFEFNKVHILTLKPSRNQKFHQMHLNLNFSYVAPYLIVIIDLCNRLCFYGGRFSKKTKMGR